MNRSKTQKIMLAIALLGAPSFSQSIGTGNPGLKVAKNESEAIVIYKDEPQTLGVGLMGGMSDRQIKVIVDDGYHFDKSDMAIPKQLFPFDSNAAFSSEGGRWRIGFKEWNYLARTYSGYRVESGKLTTFQDVQVSARAKYKLTSSDEFLGCFGGRVFFWRGFDPSFVYWRGVSDSHTYRFLLPKGTIDLYGACKGVKKEIAIVIFGKSHGLFHNSPYTHEVCEFNLSEGSSIVP